jgi:hypothetical protein
MKEDGRGYLIGEISKDAQIAASGEAIEGEACGIFGKDGDGALSEFGFEEGDKLAVAFEGKEGGLWGEREEHVCENASASAEFEDAITEACIEERDDALDFFGGDEEVLSPRVFGMELIFAEDLAGVTIHGTVL